MGFHPQELNSSRRFLRNGDTGPDAQISGCFVFVRSFFVFERSFEINWLKN